MEKRSKKDAISYNFIEGDLLRKFGNFIIRTPKQKGQIDFYVLVNGRKFMGYDIFEKYGNKNMNLRYFYCLNNVHSSYGLDDLITDLEKINYIKKVTYVTIVFTKTKDVFIMTLNQLKNPATEISPSFLSDMFCANVRFINEDEDKININEIKKILKKIVITRNILHWHFSIKNVKFIKTGVSTNRSGFVWADKNCG